MISARSGCMITIMFSLIFSVFAVGLVVMMIELKKAPVGTEDKNGFHILPEQNSPQYRLAPVKGKEASLEAAAFLKKAHSTR